MNAKSIATAAAAGILAATIAAAATVPVPVAPSKPTRVAPVRTITVKAMPPAHYAIRAAKADPTVTADGKPAQWLITSLDADSCTVWIKAEAPAADGDELSGDASVELAAYKACRVAMARSGR